MGARSNSSGGFRNIHGTEFETRAKRRPSSTTTTPEETRPSHDDRFFSADTGCCGMCRPAEVPRQRQSGPLASTDAARNWIQGLHETSPISAGTFRLWHQGPRRDLRNPSSSTRVIDRDIRPIFVANPAFGGIIDPAIRKSIRPGPAGQTSAICTFGAKFNNLVPNIGQNPAAIALRGIREGCRPGKVDAGVSTGKPDVSIRRHHQQGKRQSSSRSPATAATSGRGQAGRLFDTPTGAFMWGAGVTFPVPPISCAWSARLNGQALVEQQFDAAGCQQFAGHRPELPARPVSTDREHHARDAGSHAASEERLLWPAPA